MRVETVLLVGIIASIFVGFNIGCSSTGIAWGPAVGAGLLSKVVAVGLMTFFVFLGGWTVGRTSYDHAHNARIEDDLYNQRSICETVNSVIKRSDSSTVRARAWYCQFREITLAAAVYNVEQAIKQ